MILGVDVGGTFTDFVLVDDTGRVRLHKRLSTPADPARSVSEGVRELGLPALAPHRPPPLVPREWRFEVRERVTADGAILIPLDPQEISALIPALQSERIESVAVCLLFSFLRPEHERLVREMLEVGGQRSENDSP